MIVVLQVGIGGRGMRDRHRIEYGGAHRTEATKFESLDVGVYCTYIWYVLFSGEIASANTVDHGTKAVD